MSWSREESMKKNFLYNVIYQILILIIPLITTPHISRVLGADGIGIYSYTYSIAYYFMLIAMLGLNNYGNRTIAKVRNDKSKLSKEFFSIYSFQLFTSFITICMYVIYILLCNTSYKFISILQILYIFSSMIDINWFFFGIEKFKLTITRNTMVKVLSLIFIFVFVKKPGDVWKYTLILSGSTLLSNIILFSFLRKYVTFTKVTFKDIFKHLKPNIILFLPVVAVSIYKIMDKIMLGSMIDVKEVGYYENAAKIINVPLAIITALGTIMLPRVSNMLSNNQEKKVKKMIEKTMPFAMFMTLPMTLGMIAIASDFSFVFFGPEFKKSGYLIQLLSITLLFLSWGNVIRTEYLIPKEKDKDYVISAFIGAFVNVILNVIFIPKYKSLGACIGTIAAEFFVMYYQSYKVWKELPIKKYLKNSIPFFINSIIMFIIIYLFKFVNLNRIARIILQIIIGCIIYGLLNAKYILSIINIKKINEIIRITKKKESF